RDVRAHAQREADGRVRWRRTADRVPPRNAAVARRYVGRCPLPTLAPRALRHAFPAEARRRNARPQSRPGGEARISLHHARCGSSLGGTKLASFSIRSSAFLTLSAATSAV